MRVLAPSLCALSLLIPAFSQTRSAKPLVDFEMMTWVEVKKAMADGKTTALVYNGGTEQRGPQNVNGGHTLMGHATVVAIAEKMGNAIAAPVMPFSVNNASATYSASSTISGSSAANAFDGNQSTSWTAKSGSTGGGDGAYITVNLGAAYDICKIVIYWGSNFGKAFNIQGSNDGTTFTTLYSVSSNTSTQNVITLASVSYQYIRMQGVTRNSSTTGSRWRP